MQDGTGALRAIESSYTLPTEDQLWEIDQAWEALPGALDAVNALITGRLPAILGRVYQPGVGPDPGDPIETPERPGR